MAHFQSQPLLYEIDQALAEAIKALLDKQEEYPIYAGQVVDDQKRPYRYRFTLKKPWRVEEGAEVSLDGPGLVEPIQVRLAYMEDEITILLETNRHLPPEILPNAVLKEDPTFLLRRLREALSSVKDLGLGLALVGQRPCADREQAFRPFTHPHVRPEPAQALALRRALGSELLMLLGPPGTGKTFVLAAVAFLHLLVGHRILIASHTNIAIDNAVLRLVELLCMEGEGARIDQRQIIRQGTPRLPELEEKAFSQVTLSLIVAQEQQTLQQEYAALEVQQQQLRRKVAAAEARVIREGELWKQERSAHEQALTDCQKRFLKVRQQEQRRLETSRKEYQRVLGKQAQAAAQLEAAKQARDQTSKELNALADDLRDLAEAQQGYQKRIRKVEHWPVWRQRLPRWLSKEGPLTELQGRLAVVVQQQWEKQRQHQSHSAIWQRHQRQYQEEWEQEKQCQQQLEEILADEQRVSPELTRLASEEEALTEAMHQGDEDQHQREKDLVALQQEDDLVTKRLSKLDEELHNLVKRTEQRIVGKAQVVGATLTSLALNRHLFPAGSWDVVIIDEASMAAPAAVMLAASLANNHVIVVGDPLQLPPVCRVKGRPLVTKWLGRDVFTLGQFSLSEAATGTHHSVLLPDQNRMQPEISALICQVIYQGHLHDGSHLPRPASLEPFPDARVIVWDTSHALASKAERRHNNQSWGNLCQAEYAIQVAQMALSNYGRTPGRDKLGIITPYAAQASHLRKLLRQARLEDVIRAGTVHAFQGLQCAIIIFDTVLAPGIDSSSFLLDSYMRQGEPTTATRLLNVAVSRAQQKFCLIAHVDYLQREIRRHSQAKTYPLARILDLAMQQYHVDLHQAPKALFPHLPFWEPLP